MTDPKLGDAVTLARGPALKNRFALAPLTNQQSHADGTVSDQELHWLEMRAQGGFAMTMTCGAAIQAIGQGFAGQIGIYDDRHLPGLARTAAVLRANGSVSSVQLLHAGIRADKTLVPEPVGPSDDAETGARALTTAEVEQMRDDFIAGARRAEQAGFDGVEVHGAHGYLLAQFLSSEFNRREDNYGGSLENRFRLIAEILAGIRAGCGPDFQLGLRLSPERFGMDLGEVKTIAAELLAGDTIDYLDMSLWDVFKMPEDEAYQDRTLLAHFAELPRGQVKLAAAGKIMSARDAEGAIRNGCDFVMIGRAGILRHDFPRRALADAEYQSPPLPVTPEFLAEEGLSPVFVKYVSYFPGFVAAEALS